MRFLTPAEQQLLDSLPAVEADVLRAFFEECDARLVETGAGAGIAVPTARVVLAPVSTSQGSLFPTRKEAP